MAKRKRLTPAQPGFLGAPPQQPHPETSSAAPTSLTAPPIAPPIAPIAQVAGDSAIRAALDEVSGVLQDARSQGRMVEVLPLDSIDQGYLMRDRLVQDEEEMQALMDSLFARGQQTPIEVIALPDPDVPGGTRYGLISGWRRLTALNRLYNRFEDHQADQDRFATVKALVINPGSAREAYVAMVEENEIRVNLSLYERARITLRAMHEEIYPTTRAALQGLFGSTTRSKRSKIGTFVALVEALDSSLRHPTAIPEKLGLGLAREIARDHEFTKNLKVRLRSKPPETLEAELNILSAAVAAAVEAEAKSGTGAGPGAGGQQPLPYPLRTPTPPPITPRPRVRSTGPEYAVNERVTKQVAGGIQLSFTRDQNRIELTGPGVSDTLHEALQDWLKSRSRQ
ncbi:MAG: ParB family chromosome partitioning protein [Paracoccaceae bacterium]|jgi:ParB family chromosome partitioning protein